MTDARALADDAVHQLDRLGAVLLDDIGDGPAAQDLVARAAEARDAVARVGVAALTELSGLVVGVADSVAAGATDWSPSLGGTVMSAVDDLRTLVMRAAQFSAEDSEHLHQRAAELAVYVRVAPGGAAAAESATVVETAPPTEPVPPATPAPVHVDAGAAFESGPPATPAAKQQFVPISELFYPDGPQVVSGGVPESAAAKSDLLGASIDALDNLTALPLTKPASTGPMIVVPVETLLYKGRAALERAAAIREQIKTSGTQAPAAALDEMYDLIGLALKD